MKIKTANMEWNVLYYDINSGKTKPYNIFAGLFADKLAENIKKHKIENREQLKDYLEKDFMSHYWSRSEFEIAVGWLSSKVPDDLEKIDIWYQIKMNFDNIVDYIIQKMELFK